MHFLSTIMYLLVGRIPIQLMKMKKDNSKDLIKAHIQWNLSILSSSKDPIKISTLKKILPYKTRLNNKITNFLHRLKIKLIILAVLSRKLPRQNSSKNLISKISLLMHLIQTTTSCSHLLRLWKWFANSQKNKISKLQILITFNWQIKRGNLIIHDFKLPKSWTLKIG